LALAQVARRVMEHKVSTVLVPLLVLLVVVIVAVIGITAAATETHRATLKERLALASSMNVLYERQQTDIVEQRLSVEAVTAELRGHLVEGLERVRLASRPSTWM
jgi:cell division protein FtsL